MENWSRHTQREISRFRDGEGRPPPEPDERQRALTRIGNAAYGAGLSLLMQGDRVGAGEWLALAAERYRNSYDDAPRGSWGRPIGVIKARVLGGDWAGAEEASRWALEEGAGKSESPIGRYAAALACLVLGEWDVARGHVEEIRGREGFPADVAIALACVAEGETEAASYAGAVESVLVSFETRQAYLEDIPVADTVLVLQALARRRGIAAPVPESPLLPPVGV